MQALGLDPRLVAAEFVRPCCKRRNDDRADAAAIVAALLAPGMRFIPVKTDVQRHRVAWHCWPNSAWWSIQARRRFLDRR
ncbi:hypothetical protein LLG90_19715 [Aromatoleum toluclasticum]|uniref:hypothetical protein n=1 Tax=Aromatoleum toluclasticum TaxID=92003 RepID=UPI001D186136|nr:hypothetical protein [Aromatoleum toluclasticum]MCC4117590.1 hypothetical protein [Aromatoleum toluclasticum]